MALPLAQVGTAAQRVNYIAEHLKVSRSLVESILKMDTEMRKKELYYQGSTNFLGICSVTARKTEDNSDFVIRSRASSTLASILLEMEEEEANKNKFNNSTVVLEAEETFKEIMEE